MGTIRRLLWLGTWSVISSCFGGPTSDWPRDAEDGDDKEPTSPDESGGPQTPPRGGADAGASAARDASAPACTPSHADAGVDTVDAGDGGTAMQPKSVDGGLDGDLTDGGPTSGDAGPVNDAGSSDGSCSGN